jgi:hypothetical protein
LLDGLAGAIDEVRRHLDAIRAVIAALPEDKRREVIAAVFSATQSLGDLYSDFAADMLRTLGTLGSA